MGAVQAKQILTLALKGHVNMRPCIWYHGQALMLIGVGSCALISQQSGNRDEMLHLSIYIRYLECRIRTNVHSRMGLGGHLTSRLQEWPASWLSILPLEVVWAVILPKIASTTPYETQ